MLALHNKMETPNKATTFLVQKFGKQFNLEVIINTAWPPASEMSHYAFRNGRKKRR